MNKTELIKKLAEEASLTKKQAAAVLDCVLDTVVSTVAAGEKVALPGFGTFEKKDRPERTGRNPRTGEATVIAASSAPVFKAGKAFKDQVNK